VLCARGLKQGPARITTNWQATQRVVDTTAVHPGLLLHEKRA
jgi:hypothetical protein